MVAWYMKDKKPNKDSKRILNVPFADKEAAKAAGAQWDALIKKWWVPYSVPIAKVKKWLPNSEAYERYLQSFMKD